MTFTDSQLVAWVGAFIWPMARIGALVVAAPVLSSRQTPKTLRVGLVLVLSWVLMPLIPNPGITDLFSVEAFTTLLQQLLIGVAMGFMLQMAFASFIFGGQVMAYSMGLGFASMMDPQNGVQVPMVSQFYLVISTLFFLAIDGHLVMIKLLVDSFYVLPVSTLGIGASGLESVVAWGSQMFVGGLLMALPVMAAILLINLGLGIIGRAAPQLNIFAVGFPIAIIMGFVLMWITLPDAMAVFQEVLDDAFLVIKAILGFQE